MFFINDCSSIEVRKLITNLEPKLSSGYDNVSDKLLKYVVDSIIDALVILFNKSFIEGTHPDCMKLTIVHP